jgi:hypothetical protein
MVCTRCHTNRFTPPTPHVCQLMYCTQGTCLRIFFNLLRRLAITIALVVSLWYTLMHSIFIFCTYFHSPFSFCSFTFLFFCSQIRYKRSMCGLASQHILSVSVWIRCKGFFSLCVQLSRCPPGRFSAAPRPRCWNRTRSSTWVTAGFI